MSSPSFVAPGMRVWKGAATHAAVFLHHRGGRLSDRAARATSSPASATLWAWATTPPSPSVRHVLRHTFATQLVRDGKDPILVAELLGHGSLGTTLRYAPRTEAGNTAALDALITGH
jgi:integrase/recombinase XerC